MDREKFKLDEKIRSKRELLNIIEEKEVQLEDQKLKIQLANEEIEKIKISLEELKKDINDSIIDRVDNKLEEKESISFIGNSEKKNISFIGNSEKNTNISIEFAEEPKDENIYENDRINKEKFFLEYINKIIDEVENCEDKHNTDEIISQEIVGDEIVPRKLEGNSVEEEEKDEDELALIENLKLMFIENDNYKSIEVLNEILSNIKFIENSITDEEKILLLYLAYFYNKLDDLLENSKIINDFYYSDIQEMKLLIKLTEEKEYPIYYQIKETVLMKIIDNNKLFNRLDRILKVRIIDRIKTVSYKVFDGVYSIKDIKHGEESITLKAWVKEKDKESYKLVEGLYCKKTENLYMLDSSIYVLGLNIKHLTEDELEVRNINKQEDSFEFKNFKQEFKEEIDNRNYGDEEADDEYYIDEEFDDEEDNDSNIWTRLKEKLGLKLKNKG